MSGATAVSTAADVGIAGFGAHVTLPALRLPSLSPVWTVAYECAATRAYWETPDEGSVAELRFNKLAQCNGFGVVNSEPTEDMREHIDFVITGEIERFRVDVKARKRIKRSDPIDANILPGVGEVTCVELHGRRPNSRGWLYSGGADIIAFETKFDFLLVERHKLIGFLDKKVDRKCIVSCPTRALYSVYKRGYAMQDPDMHDEVTLVPMADMPAYARWSKYYEVSDCASGLPDQVFDTECEAWNFIGTNGGKLRNRGGIQPNVVNIAEPPPHLWCLHGDNLHFFPTKAEALHFASTSAHTCDHFDIEHNGIRRTFPSTWNDQALSVMLDKSAMWDNMSEDNKRIMDRHDIPYTLDGRHSLFEWKETILGWSLFNKGATVDMAYTSDHIAEIACRRGLGVPCVVDSTWKISPRLVNICDDPR